MNELLNLESTIRTESSKFDQRIERIPSPIRLKLIQIACLYYRPHVSEFTNLTTFVNQLLLLPRKSRNLVTLSDFDNESPNEQILSVWKNLKGIGNVESQQKLLSHIFTIEKVSESIIIDSSDPFYLLEMLVDYIKKVYELKPAIELDNLDEIFQNHNHSKSFKSFILSAMSPSLQDLMTQESLLWYYSLSEDILPKGLSYPSLFKAAQLRVDKLTVIHFAWTFQKLCNYADLLVDQLRTHQETASGIKVPSFHELVNYEKSQNLLRQLKHPTDFDLFIKELILVMEARTGQRNFRATLEEVEQIVMKIVQLHS